MMGRITIKQDGRPDVVISKVPVGVYETISYCVMSELSGSRLPAYIQQENVPAFISALIDKSEIGKDEDTRMLQIITHCILDGKSAFDIYTELVKEFMIIKRPLKNSNNENTITKERDITKDK